MRILLVEDDKKLADALCRARVQHCLAQLYVSADRMARLVAQLLALAHNEPGVAQGIDLQQIVGVTGNCQVSGS